MLYFCKKGYSYQAKNNLHRAIQTVTNNLDGLLVLKPESLANYLVNLVDSQNAIHNRCFPVEKRERFVTQIGQMKTIICTIQEVRASESSPIVEFTLYPAVGEFKVLDRAGNSQVELYQFCRQCGCFDSMACYHPAFGNCWWKEEATQTQGALCSHCHLENTGVATAQEILRPWKEVSHV